MGLLAMADTPQNDPAVASVPALSDHYHKARKLYGLTSGLLLLWELVGIELQPNPVEYLKVKLLSPEAVPAILFILVFYFAFRFVIEWSQCDRYRRQFLASRVDFYAAHVFGFVSVSIYAIQQASTTRFSDYLARFPIVSSLPIIVVYLVSGFLLARTTLLQCGTFETEPNHKGKYRLSLPTIRRKFQFTLLCFCSVVSTVGIAMALWEGAVVAKFAPLIALAFAIVSGVVWVFFFHRRYQLDKIPPAAPENPSFS
jgi:drug/metabolite transporter (DMT)-like permease